MVDARRCPNCGTELSAEAPAGLCPKCLLQAGLASDGGFESERLAATESHRGTPSPGFLPPLPSQLAARFPQLEILELLGQGGMGAVYKARQPGLDRLVAVKILPPDMGRDPTFAERFAREARTMARLSHPHITNVYDFGHSDGQFYLVMEYVDGVNLRQAIRAGSVAPDAALGIVTQVCEALQFAHEEGVVHRDIKPENILLDKRGRVKIADFGLAKLLGGEAGATGLTGTQQVMGTLRYMAPEQMEGSRDVDHRADIYSLGVVFYELLTGEVPMGRFQPPSAKVQVDVRIDEVVLRSLEREPERRYQHASEVQTDVESIAHTPRTHDAPSSVRDEAQSTEAAPQELDGLIGAATGLIVIGTLLSLILILGLAERLGEFSEWWIVGLGGPVILLGGLAMSRLRFYWLAFVASLLCLLIGFSTLWFIFLFAGLPLAVPVWGGYSLALLMEPKVRAAFARNVPRRNRQSDDVDPVAPLYRSTTSAAQTSEESDVDRLVRQMLRNNKGLIAGVRVYREATGASLSEAHAAVKGMAADEGISLAISTRRRLVEISVASAAMSIGMSIAPGDYIALKGGGMLAYVVFLIAHGIGARRDRMPPSQLLGQGKGSQAPEVTFPPPRSRFGQVWDNWWSRRHRRTVLVVQSVLAALTLYCALAFFSYHAHYDGADGKYVAQLGRTDPWFSVESSPRGGEFGFSPLASSARMALVAWILAGIFFQIERSKPTYEYKRFYSLTFVIEAWVAFAIIAVVITIAMSWFTPFSRMDTGAASVGDVETESAVAPAAVPPPMD